MKRDDYIDFHLVRDDHIAIHERLEEWAHWVRPRAQGWPVSPMFRMFRSKAFQWHRPEPKREVDTIRTLETERAVSALPECHRDAIRWCYVWQGDPMRAARGLGVSKQGLCDLIAVGRTMLRNRI